MNPTLARCTVEPPRPAVPPPAPSCFTLPPACGLARALAEYGTVFTGNGLLMRHALEAAAVQPGGTWALEDGPDLDGAFAKYLERPGVTQAYSRFEDAAEAFAEEELGLAPEEARRFAPTLSDMVERVLRGDREALEGRDPPEPSERC